MNVTTESIHGNYNDQQTKIMFIYLCENDNHYLSNCVSCLPVTFGTILRVFHLAPLATDRIASFLVVLLSAKLFYRESC